MGYPSRGYETAASFDASRKVLLAKVHIAKKQLGLDDETYRSLLRGHFGKDSAARLTNAQLDQLVRYFKHQGFKTKPATTKGQKPADHDQAGKMRALWVSLYHLGIISDASEKALSAFAWRVTGGKSKNGKARLQWVQGADAYKVIEALKAIATRQAGVDWSPLIKDYASGPVIDPRKRVLEAQLVIATKLHIAFDDMTAALAPIGGTYRMRRTDYAESDLDAAIENMGNHIRALQAKG
ncbi:gp16 family protein [Kordiimonas marina]|uniref:gp16 family protein n=1 Tax=Kordiimonas marina TaxID=2872312 RepID=UPI001FF5C0FD|nr:regulatory protein GemA [Kordiimonas marina]MCJ9428564.1 regulatory protein GemA [Kordiimonas marina]